MNASESRTFMGLIYEGGPNFNSNDDKPKEPLFFLHSYTAFSNSLSQAREAVVTSCAIYRLRVLTLLSAFLFDIRAILSSDILHECLECGGHKQLVLSDMTMCECEKV